MACRRCPRAGCNGSTPSSRRRSSRGGSRRSSPSPPGRASAMRRRPSRRVDLRDPPSRRCKAAQAERHPHREVDCQPLRDLRPRYSEARGAEAARRSFPTARCAARIVHRCLARIRTRPSRRAARRHRGRAHRASATICSPALGGSPRVEAFWRPRFRASRAGSRRPSRRGGHGDVAGRTEVEGSARHCRWTAASASRARADRIDIGEDGSVVHLRLQDRQATDAKAMSMSCSRRSSPSKRRSPKAAASTTSASASVRASHYIEASGRGEGGDERARRSPPPGDLAARAPRRLSATGRPLRPIPTCPTKRSAVRGTAFDRSIATTNTSISPASREWLTQEPRGGVRDERRAARLLHEADANQARASDPDGVGLGVGQCRHRQDRGAGQARLAAAACRLASLSRSSASPIPRPRRRRCRTGCSRSLPPGPRFRADDLRRSSRRFMAATAEAMRICGARAASSPRRSKRAADSRSTPFTASASGCCSGFRSRRGVTPHFAVLDERRPGG